MNAARLWTGGLATAVVTALVAVVGVLVARGLFDVPVLAPHRGGRARQRKLPGWPPWPRCSPRG